jgi:hypothetical protein
MATRGSSSASARVLSTHDFVPCVLGAALQALG